jgi:hypothetical protein
MGPQRPQGDNQGGDTHDHEGNAYLASRLDGGGCTGNNQGDAQR